MVTSVLAHFDVFTPNFSLIHTTWTEQKVQPCTITPRLSVVCGGSQVMWIEPARKCTPTFARVVLRGCNRNVTDVTAQKWKVIKKSREITFLG